MAWGVFKKIRDGIKKAARWVKDKVIKPVINTGKKILKSDTVKSVIDTGMKLAPALGGAVAASQGAPPQAGIAAGSAFQSIGKALGYG